MKDYRFLMPVKSGTARCDDARLHFVGTDLEMCDDTDWSIYLFVDDAKQTQG